MSDNVQYDKFYKQVIATSVDTVSGSLGGLSSIIVGQPLDTIKVRLQTSPHIFNNSFACISKTYKLEGVRGFYAGATPSIAANMLRSGTFIGFYGYFQHVLAEASNKESIRELSTFNNGIAGALAGVMSTALLSPLEFIKCNLQTCKVYSEQSKPSSVRAIVKANGFFGLYKGFRPMLLRETIGNFFFMSAYEKSVNLLNYKNLPREQINPLVFFFSGGIGGTFYWLSIYPLDVVKSRIQVGTSQVTLKNILIKEGPKGLYRGILPTILRTFLTSGICYAALEFSKKSMKKETIGHFFFMSAYEKSVNLLNYKNLPREQINPLVFFFSGGIGGTFYWLSIYPLD
ncbi:SLC25A15, partial [Cordylochernes scorpioides]